MDSQRPGTAARCPACDWTRTAAENSIRAIAQVSVDLEEHLAEAHGWEPERVQAHARAWAASAIDEQTAT